MSIPKRRWYQFSMRALFVMITLASLLFGRIAYLLQRAAFYDRQADALWIDLVANHNRNPADIDRLQKTSPDVRSVHQFMDVKLGQFCWYRQLANEYRIAARRPWTFVDETLPANNQSP